MSTIIALAYLNWGADIHFGASSARHIEEIRRLTSRMKAFTNESERAMFEAQMLYGSHVFARAKVIPDMAIAKGQEAHRYAKEIGDPNLEFLAAGGTAMVVGPGRRRRREGVIDRAAAVATESEPLGADGSRRGAGSRTPRGRRSWDAAHLERAVQQAAGSAHRHTLRGARAPGGRVKRLGGTGDEGLMARGAVGSRGVIWPRRCRVTPVGRPATRPARIASRDAMRRRYARAAGEALQAARHEDLHLDVPRWSAWVLMETVRPVERAFDRMSAALAMVAQRTMDQDAGPLAADRIGREMAAPPGRSTRSWHPTAGATRPPMGTPLLQSLVQAHERRTAATWGSTSRRSSGDSASCSRRSARGSCGRHGVRVHGAAL
jgi:hypothetical protein